MGISIRGKSLETLRDPAIELYLQGLVIRRRCISNRHKVINRRTKVCQHGLLKQTASCGGNIGNCKRLALSQSLLHCNVPLQRKGQSKIWINRRRIEIRRSLESRYGGDSEQAADYWEWEGIDRRRGINKRSSFEVLRERLAIKVVKNA